MHSIVAASVVVFSWLALVKGEVEAYDKISFTNVGFAGTFLPVSKFSDITSDTKCTCEVGEKQWFSGTNAPLADHLSVHFRGPLKLSQFAYYTSPSFVVNNNRSSSDWSRNAYYEASSQTAENVTFVGNVGDDSPCLGKALGYVSSDGLTQASAATVLGSSNSISSDQEYAIFSNVSCPKSGLGKGCGVYRSGIPAFYGFDGTTKMFLFEFEMPTESKTNSSSYSYYDLPAIWLLNDNIPRTAQYPTNSNCSCWASGCGEFDIFEVMNSTERNHFYSTFHTFQGIEDLGTGIQSYGYIPRDTENTMKGGVIFDSTGNVVTFLSNSTTFDATLTFEDVNALLASIAISDTYSSQLASISATAPTTTSKSSGFALTEKQDGIWYYLFTFCAALAHVFVI